jgi:4-amino-4-deoxy-L-arabinose transferase-like glycosyltransferase
MHPEYAWAGIIFFVFSPQNIHWSTALLIAPALVLLLACAIFLLAILRLPGRAAVLLGLYLLCYANIVLVGEITNSLFQLNNPWLWLGLHLVLAGAAWLAWRQAGRPDLWNGLRVRFNRFELWAAVKRWPELVLLSLGVGLAFVFNAVLIWIVPPNNNDSLATHMARIGYWMQHGSFFPWPTYRVWQITYPVNMQLQILWTVLFLGNDRIVEITQWLGALAGIVAVYGLARLLGASRAQAWFAGLIWATFPEIILEATSTQNDLVAGTLFAAMFYLLFLGLAKKNMGSLVLSGMALALGIGTKQTLFFLIPGLGLAVLLVLGLSGRAERKQTWRHGLIWGSSAAAAFLLLGVYMFVVNQVSFGHPMGPETAITGQTGGQTSQSLQENLLYSSFRLAYQVIDPTGLPDPLTGYGIKLKALVVKKLTGWIGFAVEAPVAVAPGHLFDLRERYVMQEDAAWYGPVFAFLVLPALLYQFWLGVRKKEPLRLSIFGFALSFWILDAVLRPGWDPYQGRYFIPVVSMASATAAFLFQEGKWKALVRWVIMALALTVMTNTFLWDSAKPISGNDAIWKKDRLTLLTQQSFYMREPAQLVEKYVPADATLGLVTYGPFLEYPFFREDFSRKLVQIYPPEQLHNKAWLRGQGIEYVLVVGSEEMPQLILPKGLVPFAQVGQWTLLVWNAE